MLRSLVLALLGFVIAVPAVATAQPRQRPLPPPEEPVEEEEPLPDAEEGEGEEVEGEESGDAGQMRLQAPMLQGGSPAAGEGGEGEETGAETAEGGELSPTDAENRLLQQGQGGTGDDASGPLGPWASKALPLFNVHGYFRTRFELFHQFHMGWNYNAAGEATPPGAPFGRPLESGEPLCGTGGDPGSANCSNNTLAGGNLRLRMNPQINVSDEVQVNVQLDLLDNLVLGSTPEGYDPTASRSVNPWAPLRAFSTTQVPPDSRNSLTDAIAVRRAWAQVRTDLGVLRFGRMGSEWGLGMVENGGDGLYSDYGDIADRVMFATRIAGITIVPMWDFAGEGATSRLDDEHTGQSYDLSQLDDVNQYGLIIARKLDEEDLRDRLQLGQVAIQGGLYLTYRDQLLSTESASSLGEPGVLTRRNAQSWTPDLWFQLQYRKFRFEMEAVLVAGSVENSSSGAVYTQDDMDILQYAGVAQVDYRLMNDKLRIGFETGLASGDSDVEGISPRGGLITQSPVNNDSTISAFRFDRDFNVDLILWEEIFSAVSSAYYFRPNVSYDFINSSMGQLFGARLDIVYSRAMFPVQTRGNSADLGVEFDLELYYRSEDGPSLTDGFVAGLRYGILIPLAGMGPLTGEPSVNLSSPQTLQAFLGIVY